MNVNEHLSDLMETRRRKHSDQVSIATVIGCMHDAWLSLVDDVTAKGSYETVWEGVSCNQEVLLHNITTEILY